MEYIEPCDYDYIMNKYHAPGKPRARFPRNDGIFDEASGMAPDGILAGVMEQDEKRCERCHKKEHQKENKQNEIELERQ